MYALIRYFKGNINLEETWFDDTNSKWYGCVQ